MAIKLHTFTMPTQMAAKGELSFPPAQQLGTDGEGRPIVAPLRTATWKWPHLYPSEADWLFQTVIGAGNNHRRCTAGVRIYDPVNGRQETDFGYAIVDLPTYDKISAGIYYGVTLTIRNIRA